MLAATRGAQQERSKRRQRVSCAEQGALAGHELAPAADEDTFVVLKGAPSRPPQASVISCCLCGARYEGYVIQIRSSLAVRLATPSWTGCPAEADVFAYATLRRIGKKYSRRPKPPLQARWAMTGRLVTTLRAPPLVVARDRPRQYPPPRLRGSGVRGHGERRGKRGPGSIRFL